MHKHYIINAVGSRPDVIKYDSYFDILKSYAYLRRARTVIG